MLLLLMASLMSAGTVSSLADQSPSTSAAAARRARSDLLYLDHFLELEGSDEPKENVAILRRATKDLMERVQGLPFSQLDSTLEMNQLELEEALSRSLVDYPQARSLLVQLKKIGQLVKPRQQCGPLTEQTHRELLQAMDWNDYKLRADQQLQGQSKLRRLINHFIRHYYEQCPENLSKNHLNSGLHSLLHLSQALKLFGTIEASLDAQKGPIEISNPDKRPLEQFEEDAELDEEVAEALATALASKLEAADHDFETLFVSHVVPICADLAGAIGGIFDTYEQSDYLNHVGLAQEVSSKRWRSRYNLCKRFTRDTQETSDLLKLANLKFNSLLQRGSLADDAMPKAGSRRAKLASLFSRSDVGLIAV